MTLVDRLCAAARSGSGITFVGNHAPTRVGYDQLHDEARAAAARLQARGIGPGSQVAILGPTTRPLVTAIQAAWLAGAAVVVLPLPMRLGSLEEFVRQTRQRILSAQAGVVLVDSDLAAFVSPEPGDPPMVTFDEVVGAGAPAMSPDAWQAPALDLDDLAILQFTSGSTAEPKGVMIPHRQLLANVDAIRSGTGLVDGDCGVSWLPLYHDMGLIGLLTTPLSAGIDLVLGAPQDFLAAPARWMEWISTYRGTHTAGPNFSYVLAARALGRGEALDLSSLRVSLNGAEPVDPATVRSFIAAGERHRLSPGAVFRPSAWPRRRSPSTSRRSGPASPSTSSTAACWSPTAMPRRPPRTSPGPVSSPSSAAPSTGWRSASPTPTRTARAATVRWANCRSAAPR